MWLSFVVAVRVLTNLSLATINTPGRLDIRRAIIMFPVVGVLLGIIYGAVWGIGNYVWSTERLVPAALTLACGAFATGARGLGGVGRVADGIASAFANGDRATALSIIRNPNRGAVGVVATIAVAALKLAFLSALPAATAWSCLVISAMLGQWAVGFCFSAFRLTGSWNNEDEGMRGFADAGLNEFFGSTILAIATAAILPPMGFVALLAAAFLIGPAAQSFNRSFGGLNNHSNFALGEIAEVIALAIFAVHFA